MLYFPSFMEISLWVGIIAVILLLTSQILCSCHGENHIVLERNRLKSVALIVGLVFILTTLAEIYNILRT